MCGILFTDNYKISREKFEQGLALMDHRGPDARGGILTFNNIKLGHNRLKILDLDDRSNQPFCSKDRRYAIIYNGEIYNFKELVKQYGIEQRTTSDTEIIVELYGLLGPGMLEQLNGMFAMIILDTESNDIFVARDRLGVKPLYYSEMNDFIIIASEIAPVIHMLETVDFDPIGLRQYRKLRNFFNGRTPYKQIKMFPAGHYMLNRKLVKYWDLPKNTRTLPALDELKYLIDSAVDYRLLSDVPVGSYLSGGLDSSIIAALSKQPDTWTVGFTDYNEFDWARQAAEYINTRHNEIIIETDEFVELAKQMVRKRKEPLCVPNEVLLYKMTQEVTKKNTVILSGEGADEVFFGYDRIFRWANDNEWNITEFSKLYSYGSHPDIEIVRDALEPFLRYEKPIHIVAAFFQIAHLHGLLRRLDNSTMLSSVEARVPFVDHRIIERMWGLPFDFRMENGIVKYPLKKLAVGLIPETIIQREKIGFPVPLQKIFPEQSIDLNPMDRWLIFNLNELGLSLNDINSLQSF